jgi:hypothetical protein
MTPPEGHPGQHAYTFVIRILSTSLASVSSFSMSAAALGMYLYVCIPLRFPFMEPQTSFHEFTHVYSIWDALLLSSTALCLPIQ